MINEHGPSQGNQDYNESKIIDMNAYRIQQHLDRAYTDGDSDTARQIHEALASLTGPRDSSAPSFLRGLPDESSGSEDEYMELVRRYPPMQSLDVPFIFREKIGSESVLRVENFSTLARANNYSHECKLQILDEVARLVPELEEPVLTIEDLYEQHPNIVADTTHLLKTKMYIAHPTAVEIFRAYDFQHEFLNDLTSLDYFVMSFLKIYAHTSYQKICRALVSYRISPFEKRQLMDEAISHMLASREGQQHWDAVPKKTAHEGMSKSAFLRHSKEDGEEVVTAQPIEDTPIPSDTPEKTPSPYRISDKDLCPRAVPVVRGPQQFHYVTPNFTKPQKKPHQKWIGGVKRLATAAALTLTAGLATHHVVHHLGHDTLQKAGPKVESKDKSVSYQQRVQKQVQRPSHVQSTPVTPRPSISSHSSLLAPKTAVETLKKQVTTLLGDTPAAEQWMFGGVEDGVAVERARGMVATLKTLRSHGLSHSRIQYLATQGQLRNLSPEVFMDRLTTLPNIPGNGISQNYLQHLMNLNGWTESQALQSDAYQRAQKALFTLQADGSYSGGEAITDSITVKDIYQLVDGGHLAQK